MSQHTPDKEVPRPWKTLGNKKELTFRSHEGKENGCFLGQRGREIKIVFHYLSGFGCPPES